MAYRVLTEWGEGTSSAADTVSFGTDAVFTSLKLAVDVNYWLQNPSENYDWIMVGDELNNATSVKFGSKNNNYDLLWPVLKLYYQGTTWVKEADPRTEMQVIQAMNSGGLLVRNPNKPGSARIDIFSITGARLWSSSHELISGDNHISTGNFDTGLYLYRISFNGISNSGKLLITQR